MEFDLDLQSYPIFEEEYRAVLNAKILSHYYFREIGQETANLFKVFFNRKMNEIMPYYNQLYLSTKIKIDPLTRMDYQEIFKGDIENLKNMVQSELDVGATSSQSNSNSGSSNVNSTTNSSKNIFADTPQNQLMNQNVQNNYYASAVTTDFESGNSKSINEQQVENENLVNATSKRDKDEKETTTNYENYIKTIKGNNANRTDSEMLLEYRQTFINIDMMIIQELESCFMQLW